MKAPAVDCAARVIRAAEAVAALPRDIVNKIASETIRTVRMPDINDKMPVWGGDGAGTTPEAFAVKFKEDIARYARVIKQANVPPAD